MEANHLKARSWQKQATLAPKKNQKVCQNHQNISKRGPKLDEKWRLRRGCVFRACRGGPGAHRRTIRTPILGAIFGPFSMKIAKNQKGDLIRRHFGALGRPRGAKKTKNGVPEGVRKWRSKNDRKLMPKWSKNDAKIDAKIDEKKVPIS